MHETQDATAIFAPLWKRKWLILIVGVVVAVATYAYYDHKQPVYGAATAIYLGNGSEVQALIGEAQANGTESDRSITNQVVLINSSVVGSVVQRRLLREGNVDAATGAAQAGATAGSDFSISARAHTAQGAADLANAYAGAYLHLREANYRRNIEIALNSTEEQLRSAEEQAASTATEALQIQNLVEPRRPACARGCAGDASDRQMNRAVASTAPLSPKPTRNAIFAFALGIVLAALVAYALSRFDRRLRSLTDIEAAFQAPVLAAVPAVRHPLGYVDGQAVPSPPLREPLRRLHTTLQLRGHANDLDQPPAPRSVLFISADADAGKSTLLAGLGLVQSEAGERVVIVDSDLRRPAQAELLAMDGIAGLAEVLAGKATVQEATRAIRSPATSSGIVAGGEGGVAPVGHGCGVRFRAAQWGDGRQSAGAACRPSDADAPAFARRGIRLRPGRCFAATGGEQCPAAAGDGRRDRDRRPRRPDRRDLGAAPRRPALARPPRPDPRDHRQRRIGGGSGGFRTLVDGIQRARHLASVRTSSSGFGWPGVRWQPATTFARRGQDLREIALTAGIALLVAFGIAVKVPDPNFFLAAGIVFGMLGLVCLAASTRYEVTLAILVLYFGLLDGVVKLETANQLASSLRDLMIAAICMGVLARLVVKREKISLPPLSGWVVAFVLLTLVEAANPNTQGILKVVGGFRQHLEWIPFFFVGYYLMRSKERFRKFFILLGVIALANGVVSTIQTQLTPEELLVGPG